MTDPDLVGEAIAELYGCDLEIFTERRQALAARARGAGDRPAAKTIAALGKPTRSAWIVNKLARADPTVAARLSALGDQLRAGEAALDGASIRELSRGRRQLVQALVRQSLAQSGQGSASAALREELAATFNAALADPQVAELVAAGTLLRAARWAGFTATIGSAAHAVAGQAVAGQAVAERAAAEQAAAERAMAEQAVADASRAVEEAAAAERERADDLKVAEQQLAQAHERLRQAQALARQAVTTLHQARRALGRLQG